MNAKMEYGMNGKLVDKKIRKESSVFFAPPPVIVGVAVMIVLFIKLGFYVIECREAALFAKGLIMHP